MPGGTPGPDPAKGQLMHQQDSQPGTGPPAAGTASDTWEAIEPYQPQPGFWRGRAQLTDGHTTLAELCAHPWLSQSRPGHDDEPAARACGQELAATLRAAQAGLGAPLAAQVRALPGQEPGAGMAPGEMAWPAGHGLEGGGPAACREDHTYLVADPGNPPLYEGTDSGQAWRAALSGFTSDGRFRAHVTARHRDTRTCQLGESRVRQAALACWLAGQPAAAPGREAGR